MAKLAKSFGEVSQAHTKRAMVVGRLLRIRQLVAPASDQPSQGVDGSGLFVRVSFSLSRDPNVKRPKTVTNELVVPRYIVCVCEGLSLCFEFA